MMLPWGMLCYALVELHNLLDRTQVVETSLGRIQGSVLHDCEGKKVFSFRGIPYAKSPVRHRRFQPPEPVEPWTGILDATKESPECIQRDAIGRIKGTEDCLFLNVYTPELVRDKRLLPVMVFIHGGAFLSGSSSSVVYYPLYLVSKGVILVTINYRIGAMGFLSTEDGGCPGNNGLRDIITALKWVRENIGHFGGNRSSVTLFGESAGGTSVHLLMLSPASQGLFQRAISQSGSVMSRALTYSRGIRQRTWDLSRSLNCSVDSTEVILSCLRKKSALQILKRTEDLHQWATFPYPFTPRVDREAEQPVLPEEPIDMLLQGKYVRIPWISGVNENEGYFWTSTLPKDFKSLMKEGKKGMLRFCSSVLGAGSAKDCYRMMRLYSRKANSSLLMMEEFMGDSFMLAPQRYTQNMQSLFSPVYAYLFSCLGNHSLAVILGYEKEPRAVGHGDDILYLFGPNYIFAPIKKGDKDFLCMEYMTELWTSFAKTGRPHYGNASFHWPPFTIRDPIYLRIAHDVSLVRDYKTTEAEMWKDFYRWPSMQAVPRRLLP